MSNSDILESQAAIEAVGGEETSAPVEETVAEEVATEEVVAE